MKKSNKEILKELETEFGLSEHILHEVESSMYRFLKKSMKEEKNVMLPYIGKFIINERGVSERNYRRNKEQGVRETEEESTGQDGDLQQVPTQKEGNLR